MDRRLALAALACWPAACALAQDEPARARHKVPARQLYEAMAARFPLRLAPGGLVDLQVSAPQLLLLPARNRLGATLAARIGGLQVPAGDAGELDLLFAVRYEAKDRSLRAHSPEVLDVRWPGLPPETRQVLRALLPAMAQNLGELVLHRFSPRELALPDTMGLQPEEVRVVDDGLLVFFGNKPAS